MNLSELRKSLNEQIYKFEKQYHFQIYPKIYPTQIYKGTTPIIEGYLKQEFGF